jgi:hypothetical protein
MANIVYKTHADPQDYPPDLHILTFAEQGFAPLDIHGRRLGVSRDTLSAFSDAVNQAGDVGSLYPEAPISAVPQSCIRDTADPEPLLSHLREFISANAERMRATSLLLDFSTPRLQPHVQAAITAVFDEPGLSLISHIIVIRN